MRKSFTRLLSLVMLLGLISFQVSAVAAVSADKVWPLDGTSKAYTKTSDKLMIIYPEAMVASTGSVRLMKGTSLVQVIPATDSRVSIAKGDTIEIDLSANLMELTEYTVNVDASAFKTADDGEASAAISGTWVFTTGDYTAPTLKEVAPVKGAVVADQTTYTLEMTFNDASAVLKGTGKISLYKADGNIWDLIDVATQGTLSGSKITLSGLRPLEDNTNYVVTIDAGVATDDGLRADAKKNAYAGLTDRTTWTFSSKDFSIPGYASGYPKKANEGNTSVDILVKATEVGTAYAYAVADGASAPTAATIKAADHKVAVAAVDTEYTISLTGLGVAATSAAFDVYVIIENADVAAVDADAVKVDVTTTENTAPKLSTVAGEAVTYKKGSTVKTDGTASGANVITTSGKVDQTIDNIILDFDEEVKIGSGSIIIRKAADNSDLLTIDASSLSLMTDKSQVKVPVSGFANNASYYVLIPNTIILDKYNNKYAGMTATTAWAFTTNDVVGPTFTYTPTEGASNVDKDANIVLTFDELIYVQTGFDITAAYNGAAPANPFQVQVDGVSVAFGVTETTNDGKYTKYTIDPTASFTSEAVVTVIIKANSLADVGGNVVDPEGQGIVFVVEDYVSPVLSFNNPTKPTDKVEATFDEPVYLVGGGEITDANLFTILTVKETDQNGANVAYTATIDANKKKITITPDSPWSSEKTYYVAISSDLQDGNGTAFDGTGRTKTFTIADVTSATVDLSSVDGKTISTGDAITMIFKEGSSVEARDKLYFGGAWQNYALGDMNKVIILKEGSATGPDVAFTVTNTAADDATFGIVASLAGNKTYYLGIAGSTKGVDGNVNDPKFVTFSTKYEGVPTVSSLSPADNSTEVAKGSNFVITFNTDVQLAAGYTTGDIYFSVDNGTTHTKDVSDTEIGISGKVVTINPSSDLNNDTSYDLIVGAGTFENKNKPTSVSAAIAADAWDFVTKDTQMELLTISPDNATSVAINAKLVMTFNEKVKKGTGYFDIKLAGSDALVERIDVTSSKVALSNGDKTVTVTPGADFKYLTDYYVEVSAGALLDLVNNPLAAIDGKTVDANLTEWTFTTADPAITIASTTPADGTDKIASDASITVVFNREIKAGTGAVGYIEAGGTDQLQAYPIGSTNITISGKTLTITHPDKVFPANTEIFIYIEAGAIKAATGSNTNALVNKTSTPHFSFNTGDVNAPVATVEPKAYAVTKTYEPVETNIVITFDEDIYNEDGTTITNADVTSGGLFTVDDGASVNFVGTISGRTVTLDPTSDLAENALVTVTVKANQIEDSKGQTITSDVPYTFMTVDKTAPTITAFTLTGGNKKITVPNVTVTDPNKNKFYYMYRVKSTDVAPSAADIKAANNKSATSGTVATFDITGLAPSTTYEFFYVADDSRGNTTAVAKLEATTDDTVAPTLASTDPATGAVDVNVSGSGVVIKLTFSENVQAGSGAITVRDYATQGLLYLLDETDLSAVAGDSKSLNLTIPGVATSAAPMKMYVEIAAGTITDAAASPNSYAGLFGMDALAFTTEDNAAPTVVATSSTKGNVSLTTNITVAFNENVQAGTANMILYEGSVDPANALQVFSAAEAVFSGKTATVNPTADLVNGQVYVVSVEAGFAKDVSSNKNANVASTAVTFTGTTNPKPYVSSFSPSGGSTPIAKVGFNEIHVQFSENIYLTVAGYSKSLVLLTQAELLAHVSFVDGNGLAIPINNIEKVSGSHFDVEFSDSKLNHESTYVLTISGFEDMDGQVMDVATATYHTSDGLAPSITFNPANKATKVSQSTSITLTFSEDVYEEVIDANKNIFAYIDNTNVKNFVYLREGSASGTDVAFTASISGRVITIVPSASLKPNTRYYVGMLRDVEDINGTVLATTDAGAKAYFDTEDTVIPALGDVTAANFAPLGASTAATASMWVKFSEEVVVSTGSVVIRREDGTIFQTVSGADLTIDSSDKTKLKIAHNNFEILTDYFVELTSSVVVDKSGNPNAAYSNAVDGWLFTTRDTYDLTAETSPVGENTPRTVTLELMFNKAPIASSNKYLAVYKEDGTAVYQVEATSMMIDGMKAYISGVALDADQAYYARVEASAFADASGNKYAGIMDNSWVFSTVDNIAPKVVTLSPEDNAIDVDTQTDFMVTFDRDIKVGTGMIAIRYSVDGTLFDEIDVTSATIDGATLSFSASKALDDNTNFYVIIPEGAVTNTEVTADPFAGIVNTYTWNFSTSTDQTAPMLVTWTPNMETIEKNHPTLVMTFDEPVALSTAGGSLMITRKDSTEAEVTVALTAAMISEDGMTVTVDYVAADGGLDKNADYFVTVDAGALEDMAGNAFAGVSDAAAWTFKTGADFATVNDDLVSGSLEFKVYPNPFDGYVTVDNADQLSRIIITNVAGQRVKDIVSPERIIKTGDLRSGIYFITLVKDGEAVKTDRIVKR